MTAATTAENDGGPTPAGAASSLAALKAYTLLKFSGLVLSLVFQVLVAKVLVPQEYAEDAVAQVWMAHRAAAFTTAAEVVLRTGAATCLFLASGSIDARAIVLCSAATSCTAAVCLLAHLFCVAPFRHAIAEDAGEAAPP